MNIKEPLIELLTKKRDLSHKLNLAYSEMVGKIKEQCLKLGENGFEDLVKNKCKDILEDRTCRHEVSKEIQLNNALVKECKDKTILEYKAQTDLLIQDITAINKIFLENTKSLGDFKIESDKEITKARSELGCSKESMNDFRKTSQFSKLETCQIELIQLELKYIDDYFQE